MIAESNLPHDRVYTVQQQLKGTTTAAVDDGKRRDLDTTTSVERNSIRIHRLVVCPHPARKHLLRWGLYRMVSYDRHEVAPHF